MSGEIKTPFDIVSGINEKRGFLEDVDDMGGLYDAYVINRAFSNTQDAILFANEMNMAWDLPKSMQYAFYYYGLPKNKRRFGKWYKPVDDKAEVDVIREYFGYTRHKARQVLSLLRPHIETMRQELDRGGREKSIKRRRPSKK